MKAAKEQRVITKQISRRLEKLRPLIHATSGIGSWIDYVRLGLGMSLTQLAARLGITQASVSGSIKLEKEGRITINKLREVADAMDCDLIYEFVPRKKLEDIIRDQAVKKTLELMSETDTHMTLENQKITLDKDERLKDLVEERIYSKYLWDK
jgi:predicted DNA-binding mobile mystery protein A